MTGETCRVEQGPGRKPREERGDERTQDAAAEVSTQWQCRDKQRRLAGGECGTIPVGQHTTPVKEVGSRCTDS